MSKSQSNATSYEIDKNLHLVHQTVAADKPAKPVETSTNHIAMIDCSGSMYSELPKIREQLKKKLPKMMKEGDTLSLVWFSGKGEFGVLLEAEPIASLKDLADVNKAIDRWLKTVGLTGFKEPILEVEKLVGRVSKKNKNPFALFFMSDGCDNQWNRADILKAVEQAAGKLAASVFVEYGYYADRPLLSAMAQQAGGVHIHADAFDKYEVTFEAALARRAVGGKRIEVKIDGDAIGGFAYALADGEITTFDASSGKVAVPEGTTGIFYLAPTSIGTASTRLLTLTQNASVSAGVSSYTNEDVIAGAYGALSLFAVRMKPEVVFPILKSLGDVRFIEGFSACFGKQKYSEFMDAAKFAAFDAKLQFVNGWDPKRVPPDDAFTVLDLLDVLSNDENAKILFDHPDFKYSRISRARVDADENLSADEQLAVEVVRNQMAGEKSAKKLKELQAELDKILASKKDALKFVADPAPDGYPISALTYNESQPNVSVLVRKTGTVNLRDRFTAAPGGEWKISMRTENIDAFPTFIFRNYAIIQNGLVNVEKLPMTMSKATYETLQKAGVDMTVQLRTGRPINEAVVVINVKPLPIINRKMVKAVSAKTFIELEYELTKKRAAQKVYKAYLADKFPGIKAQSLADKYTKEGADWLAAQGLGYNGFSPKMVLAESKDFIVGKELEVKIKGMSTMPSVKDVRGGKKSGSGAFMHDVITDVDAWLAKNPEKLHKDWLEGKTKMTISETRGLIHQAAKQKFGVLVGQIWFQEFASLDENSMSLKIDGATVDAKIELREIEIKV